MAEDETAAAAPVGGTEVTIVNENLEISMNAANRSGLSVPPLTEDDRTQRAWALQILRRTSGGNADVIALADSLGTPWVREFKDITDLLAVAIAGSEGDLWNPAEAATVLYQVWFNVINFDASGASIVVTVGREEASTGGLAAPNYWLFNEIISYPGESGWKGPFWMHGDDAVRGVCGAADDAGINIRSRRVDIGA